MARATLTARRLMVLAAILAIIVLATAKAGLAGRNIIVSLVFWLALELLLTVPAVALRANGFTARAVFLAAIGIPFIVFELALATAALSDHTVGGDVQNIEQQLMLAIAAPIALIGAAVAASACLLIRPTARKA